jgi:tetratricopeptide (TPR) repeat protein
MTFRIFAAALLLLVTGTALRAGEPLPPAVGLTADQAKERAVLLGALAATKNDDQAREAEDRLRAFWRGLGDEQSRALWQQSHDAQMRFDYVQALRCMQEVVRHQPQYAEGWNELGYVYFLAGQYDDSLDAIDHVLALEPMHYAALAGRGIILYYFRGDAAAAQAPLKRALAIDPWLKERNLIGKDSIPMP